MEFQWDAGNRPKIEQRFSCEEIEDALMFGEPVLYLSWEDGEEWRYRVVTAHVLGDLLGIVFVLRGGAVRPFSAFYVTSKDEERAWKRRKPKPPLG